MRELPVATTTTTTIRRHLATMITTTPSTPSPWKTTHSPPGSLMSIIRTHPHVRLYVDPLLWTLHHLQLLKVLVEVSETTPTPARPHRPTCSRCNRCGKVPSSVLDLLQAYPYRTEKDRNLMRLVRSTIKSFETPSGAALFNTSTCKQHRQLPFSFGGKRQCWVVPPLVVRDISSGAALIAFTHESDRCDAFENRFPGCAGIRKAKANLVTTTTDIDAYNVAVLIAMAQEAQHVQSRSKSKLESESQDLTPVLFKVSA
jgi:hypothetical protein